MRGRQIGGSCMIAASGFGREDEDNFGSG